MLSPLSNTKGFIWVLDGQEQMYRAAKIFGALKNALSLRRNAETDRSGAIVCQALSTADDFVRSWAGTTSLQILEPIVEGCFYEAERLLCSGELSPSSRDRIKHAFLQHDDSDRIRRAIQYELKMIETWDASSLRRAFRSFVCGGNSRFGFAHGLMFALRYLPSELKHQLDLRAIMVGHFLRDLRNRTPNPSLVKMRRDLADSLADATLPYPDRINAIRERKAQAKKHYPHQAVENDAWMLTRCRLVLQAIAIQSHEQNSGKMPDSIHDVETYIDPYSGQPFQYERLGRGFRLTSAGPGANVDNDLHCMMSAHFCPLPGHLDITVVPTMAGNVEDRPLGLVAKCEASSRWVDDHFEQWLAETDPSFDSGSSERSAAG